jgi:ubiquinone/menaquinone biosynthesis C-methylase UbiE
MPTHQEIAGFSDDEMVQRMINTHLERFDAAFWDVFDIHVQDRLPTQPVVVDIGCGPGLFLRNIGERYPQSTLYGYDVTPAMIAYAQQTSSAGSQPTFTLHDIMASPLPLEADSVHMVTMNAVLHVLSEPLRVCAEIKRVLVPGGVFLLNDWIRTPLKSYLESRTGDLSGDALIEAQQRGYRLFSAHNKYTTEDWLWLLSEAGFHVCGMAQTRPHFRIFVNVVA